MAQQNRRDPEGSSPMRRVTRPGIRAIRRALPLVSSVALAWSLMLSAATPSIAEPGTRVDVEPEVANVVVGQTVTLTAVVHDSNGNPSVGADTNTHVRWFFSAGSPNDIDSPGNSPDLQCWTGTAGMCSITYVPSELGTDAICALVGGPTSQCDEAAEDPEWEDRADVVLRIVATDPTPTPTPTPSPTPTPTPMPTPTPSPTPTPTPTPSPTPTPTPTPTPSPTPTPTPTPTPSPTPSPTPTPTPTPTPSPTPTSQPPPEILPHHTATPAAVPAPASISMPEPTPEPTPEPAVAQPKRTAEPAEPDPMSSGPIPQRTSRPEAQAEAPAPVTEPAPPPPAAPADTAAPIGPGSVVSEFVTAAVEQMARVVRPEAAIAVATEFTFPLVLALAVLVFLVIQGHVDRRDPKLRLAPQHVVETYLEFQGEEQL